MTRQTTSSEPGARQRIFISWSRETGREVATVLSDWLPRATRSVVPLFSPAMSSGEEWRKRLREMLTECDAGMVVLTPESLQSPWLAFEAGIINADTEKRMKAVAFGMPPDYRWSGPLDNLQFARLDDPTDVFNLVREIGEEVGLPPAEMQEVEREFDARWEVLQKRLSEIGESPAHQEAVRRLGPCSSELTEIKAVATKTLDRIHSLIAASVSGSARFQDEREDFEASFRQQRLSTALSLQPDEDAIDRHHHYLKIRRVDVADRAHDRYLSCRWLRIRNVTDEPTARLVHHEFGESKIHFQDLHVEARSPDFGALEVVGLSDVQPNNGQKFEIRFPHPLAPGEEMDIDYRFSWPREPDNYSQELSQSMNLTSRYPLGVEDLSFSVYDTGRDIVSADVVEFAEDFVSKEPLPGRQFPRLSSESGVSTRDLGNPQGVRFERCWPAGSLYRIIYRLDGTAEEGASQAPGSAENPSDGHANA